MKRNKYYEIDGQLYLDMEVKGNEVYFHPYECEEEPQEQEQPQKTIKFQETKKYVDCKYQDSYITIETRKTKTIGVSETCTNLYNYPTKKHNKRIKTGVFKDSSGKTIVSEYVLHENHLLSNCYYIACNITGKRNLKLLKTIA